ncbi:MAG: ABC transporter ATP-binding protein [Actinobacteria bacterium]|nr:ABC transporter ATP-binding protein [Actinomycetota bacterium]
MTATKIAAGNAAPKTANALYELRGASRHFGSGATAVKALDEISATIGSGEFVVIEGASGSGKTTLLQLLGALDAPTAGQVLFDGRDMTTLSAGEQSALRRDAVGFVFQQFNLIPTLTARQNVEIAMVPRGTGTRERAARASELLERVGLGGRLEHLPLQLSGGEQQRVAIARALANDARVLLADEPTGNLDSATGAEVLNLLHRLWSEHGLTIILITHDPGISQRASRLLRMCDGRIVEDRRIK